MLFIYTGCLYPNNKQTDLLLCFSLHTRTASQGNLFLGPGYLTGPRRRVIANTCVCDGRCLLKTNEPRCEKTGLRCFQPGLTQTGLYSHRRLREVCNFGFRKKRDCTFSVGKTKAGISFAVTAKLIPAFVFAYAKSRFSHD